MVNIRRQRLKAIRSGVPVEKANKCDSISGLVKLMEGLHDDVSKRLSPKD